MRAANFGTTVTPGEIARRGTTRRIADYERLPGVSGPQADTCRSAGYARAGVAAIQRSRTAPNGGNVRDRRSQPM
jgi:hypothetical protein